LGRFADAVAVGVGGSAGGCDLQPKPAIAIDSRLADTARFSL
jgi:hypothetical protein